MNARWPVPAASLPPPPPPKKRAPDRVEAGPASGSLCCALQKKRNEIDRQNLPQSEAADTACCYWHLIGAKAKHLLHEASSVMHSWLLLAVEIFTT